MARERGSPARGHRPHRGARRREVRAALARPGGPGRGERLQHRHVLWALCFLSLLTLFATALMALGRDRPRFQVGDVALEPVTARVRFEAVEEKATQKRRNDAEAREPAVYEPNTSYLQRVREDLLALAELGQGGGDESEPRVAQIPEKTRRSLQVDEATLRLLQARLQEEGPGGWRELVDTFVAEGLASLAVLEPARAEEERDPRQRSPAIVIDPPRGGTRKRYNPAIYSAAEDADAIRHELHSLLSNRVEGPLSETMVAAVMNNLQPTYRLNEARTKQRKQEARAAAEPKLMTYDANEVLVPAGRRITKLDLEILAQERAAYKNTLGRARRALVWAARAALLLLLGAGLWAYALRYNERLVRQPAKGLALTGLLVAGMGMAVGGAYIAPWDFGAGLFAVLAVGMVLSIVHDRRFALIALIVHALLVTLALSLNLRFALVLIVAGALLVAQLDEVRTRSKVVRAGAATGAAAAFATLVSALSLESLHLSEAWRALGMEAIGALGAGVAGGLLVQGLLPAIERAFRVSTAMTLRELNDASQPLLRRLAERAPGTYQHSLRIADMAEAAAEAIGAHGLLCRVGAMYHDIGKINKPHYFVENQQERANEHERLSPTMSQLVIIGHVKDGMEMAREYGLPPDVRQFIETHHGTTLVEYFYHAAMQKSAERHGPGPSEFEFRYPGPKPRTREAGILLLADPVEGAVRSLQEPTPGRIEQLVQRISKKRLLDGQFDECGLTLREVRLIEEALIRTLQAIYHGRVRYPSSGGAESSRERPAVKSAAS